MCKIIAVMLELKLKRGYFCRQKSPGKTSESLSAISSKILLLELNFFTTLEN
jgi:hypothetical protein